jgi:four helix bundle protein
MNTPIKKFQDLRIWQKSLSLSKTIYELTMENRDFAFRDQIRRAVISVGANISEGFHRNSRKEFKYFLGVARGSLNEVHNFLILGRELKYFNETEQEERQCAQLSWMILNLIKSLEK